MQRFETNEVQAFETAHIETVRKIAPECTLFLKRDETFPVETGKVALFGSGARKTIKGGTGSGDVNVRHFVTVEEGLENAGFEIATKGWLDSYDELLVNAKKAFIEQVKKEAEALGISPIMYGMGKTMPEPEYQFPLESDADTAIYVLGRISGEGADRAPVAGDINLSETEIRDIKALNKAYAKFILVLNVGGMVNLEPVNEVNNILLLGQLGTPVGDVLADILLGKSNPSGKLTMTWAPIDQYPSTEGFGDMDDTVYTEGIYVGYRYFETAGKTPTYAFGYGLSYTSFELSDIGVEADEKTVTACVKVTNTGRFPGKEVVQVYFSAPCGKLDKPACELAAFAKTKELQPGESQVVTVSYETNAMTAYDEETASYIMEAGKYVVRVGNASDNTRAAAVLDLDETAVIRKCKNICSGDKAPLFKVERDASDEDIAGLPSFSLKAKRFETLAVQYSESPAELAKTEGVKWADVVSGANSLDEFVGGLTDEQLALMSIGRYEDQEAMGSMIGAAAKSVAGAAGESCQRLEELGVPTFVMADGPAGIRVCTQYKVVGDELKAMDNPLAAMMDFMDEEMLKQMAAMAPKPTEEELNAPINYVYCTAIPIGTELAQSFNLEAVEALGDLVGEEMETFGIHVWLAPAMNIQRSPLCGRDFEYYSEDPLVSALIAVAITKGVQKHKGCGTCIKHFALNNQETNRMRSNSVVTERAIREIYLKPFEICIRESQPMTLMSSYNLVNGEHTNNSKDLLTYVLRDEWGYEGLVMTDWYAAGAFMQGGRADKHPAGVPSGCVYAGNDLVMPGMKTDLENILEALGDDGKGNSEVKYPITRGELQLTAKRVLKTVLECN